MSDFHVETVRTARKDYRCDISRWILNDSGPLDDLPGITAEDAEIMRKIQTDGCRIRKGDRYVYQSGVYDGYWYNRRAIPEVLRIAYKCGFFRDYE